jgi:hypothetical protein
MCAPALDPGLTPRGSVSVFTRSADAWQGPVILQSSSGHIDDGFGIAVDVDGDLAFVGASGDDARYDRAGAVYVFERIQGVWTEIERLTASDAVRGDGFGGAVAYSDGRLIVGAPLEGHGLAPREPRGRSTGRGLRLPTRTRAVAGGAAPTPWSCTCVPEA